MPRLQKFYTVLLWQTLLVKQSNFFKWDEVYFLYQEELCRVIGTANYILT